MPGAERMLCPILALKLPLPRAAAPPRRVFTHSGDWLARFCGDYGEAYLDSSVAVCPLPLLSVRRDSAPNFYECKLSSCFVSRCGAIWMRDRRDAAARCAAVLVRRARHGGGRFGIVFAPVNPQHGTRTTGRRRFHAGSVLLPLAAARRAVVSRGKARVPCARGEAPRWRPT